MNETPKMPDSERPRRWTIKGMTFKGHGVNRVGVFPTIEPSLAEGEVVEVMPVAEHEAEVERLCRIEQAAREVCEVANPASSKVRPLLDAVDRLRAALNEAPPSPVNEDSEMGQKIP